MEKYFPIERDFAESVDCPIGSTTARAVLLLAFVQVIDRAADGYTPVKFL
jgi:hypothetical protein